MFRHAFDREQDVHLASAQYKDLQKTDEDKNKSKMIHNERMGWDERHRIHEFS